MQPGGRGGGGRSMQPGGSGSPLTRLGCDVRGTPEQEPCQSGTAALKAELGSPENALEDGSSEAGIHKYVVSHECRPLFHSVEQNAV